MSGAGGFALVRLDLRERRAQAIELRGERIGLPVRVALRHAQSIALGLDLGCVAAFALGSRAQRLEIGRDGRGLRVAHLALLILPSELAANLLERGGQLHDAMIALTRERVRALELGLRRALQGLLLRERTLCLAELALQRRPCGVRFRERLLEACDLAFESFELRLQFD